MFDICRHVYLITMKTFSRDYFSSGTHLYLVEFTFFTEATFSNLANEEKHVLRKVRLFDCQRVQAWEVFPLRVWGRICFSFSSQTITKDDSAIPTFPRGKEKPSP